MVNDGQVSVVFCSICTRIPLLSETTTVHVGAEVPRRAQGSFQAQDLPGGCRYRAPALDQAPAQVWRSGVAWAWVTVPMLPYGICMHTAGARWLRGTSKRTHTARTHTHTRKTNTTHDAHTRAHT